MKTNSPASLLLTLVGLAALSVLSAGCSNLSTTQSSWVTQKRTPTFALAVSIVGGAEPSAAQWKALQNRFALSVANRGGVLINDLARADYIIRVDFLPDPLDPNGGTALIDGIRRNVKEVAVSPYPTSPASFASANPYSWGMGYGFGSDYYGYGSYYGYGYPYGYGYNYGYPYDYPGYSSGGGYVATPPVTKPGTGTPGTPHHPGRPHHPGTPHPPGTHPTNPGDCPPGRVYLPPPPGFVWTPPPGHGPRHPRDGGSTTSSSSDYASSRRESSYNSRNDSSYSSSYSGNSDSSYSSSRSYDPVGPSSYTPSSNTSMSFASSSSSSSSYSAPAPVSSPPSDSGSSRGTENARQN